jgi:DNA-binding MarR family transcriptional regulator
MDSPSTPPVERVGRSEIALQLLSRAAALARLAAKQVSSELSRTEANMLNSLTTGALRITDLADVEGLAQPTTTLLVKRLEHRGWVRRERQDHDGRIVMVSLTPAGSVVLEEYRSFFSAALLSGLAEVATEDEIDSLISATGTLDALIVALQAQRR